MDENRAVAPPQQELKSRRLADYPTASRKSGLGVDLSRIRSTSLLRGDSRSSAPRSTRLLSSGDFSDILH